jgi:ribonuclease HI
MDCRSGAKNKPSSIQSAKGAPTSDPATGVFTDGSSSPNPGPGGWGVVYVQDNQVIDEAYGYGGDTTNNRMELLALIRATDLVPEGVSETVYSDSKLAVQTINEWAAGWERRGWKRKSGPVENLDLVKEAYAAYKKRGELDLVWIKAHVGFRWNEYADELANRGRVEGKA